MGQKNRNKIPRVRSTNDVALQKTELSTVSMSRSCNILESPEAANLCNVIDIFADGYGIIKCDAIIFVFGKLYDKSKVWQKTRWIKRFLTSKYLQQDRNIV